MKRALAIAFVAAVSLAPACKMREQMPQNTNLNKAPIVETIRDAGVKMTDDREGLNAIPKKMPPEQKAAEQADAGVAKETPPVHGTKRAQDRLDEALKKIDWSKLEIKQTPRGPAPKVEGRIH